MGWAAGHIEKLKRGETVQFRPKGHSMTGRVDNGALVTVEPFKADPAIDDVVLCKVGGNEYLHLVKAVNGGRFLIGNNRGGTNGWTGRTSLFGIVVKVEP